MICLFSLTILGAQNSRAAVFRQIVFPANSYFSAQDHLLHLLGQIGDRNQMRLPNPKLFSLKGDVRLDFSNLDPVKKADVVELLLAVLKGETSVMGAVIEARGAMLSIVGDEKMSAYLNTIIQARDREGTVTKDDDWEVLDRRTPIENDEARARDFTSATKDLLIPKEKFVRNFPSATKVIFPNNPRFRVGQFLVFMLRKIPLKQYELVESNVARIHGSFLMDLSELDRATAQKLKLALDEVLAGQVSVSGLIIDASGAKIDFVGYPPEASCEESLVESSRKP